MSGDNSLAVGAAGLGFVVLCAVCSWAAWRLLLVMIRQVADAIRGKR